MRRSTNLTSALLALLIPLALIGCSPEPEEQAIIDYSWLQGEWISGIEQTQEANSARGKPISPSAGKLIWSVQNNRLYSTDHSIDLQEDSLFDIEQVSQSELRLITQSMDDFIVTQTEFGFCSEAFGMASDLITIDCFVPYH